MAKLLGIDIGTSGCKALLIDETGRVLKSASAEYPLSVPRPMWSEQDPEDWWQGVEDCLEAIGERRPDAIGVTGQMHGAVFLNDHDEVIRPAILWNDQRTSAECHDIDATLGSANVRRISCNPPLTGFQLPKLLWLRKHEPESYLRLRSILLPKDYIRFKLSGVKATEVSDASGTGIFEVPSRRWSQEMMLGLDLDPSLFPRCYESDEVTSHTLASRWLDSGTPIVGGGGDQAAAAVGTGAVAPGVISLSLGTSGVVFTSLEKPEFAESGATHTFCHANRGWHAMGVMLSCGGALRWYRDTFGGSSTYNDLASEAAEVPIGSDGLTFLPYLSGERTPHNDPLARASFSGATLAHRRAHFSRAVFEGMSFGLRDGLGLLRGLGAKSDEIRVTGGGARSPFWVQLIADVLGTPCVTLECDEGPAFGAAILAGVGISVWPDSMSACRAVIRFANRYEPRGNDYESSYKKYRELYAYLKSWNIS